MPTVIALDAMGSERAPKPEIEGAILAARHHNVGVLLVGPEAQLRNELAHHPLAQGLPIDVVKMFGKDADSQRAYDYVTTRMQEVLTTLAAERVLPPA